MRKGKSCDMEELLSGAGNRENVVRADKADGIVIRHTEVGDLPSVMSILDYARKRMRESGNPTQWVDGYPSSDVILDDISNGSSYVIESGNRIVGVFAFIIGDEPNYSVIEGCWPDAGPYGTIHRIAAAPGVKGVANAALGFCKRAGVAIRIDTHADNAPMLGWIAKQGFSYCGIIHVGDGTPRKAFHLDI